MSGDQSLKHGCVHEPRWWLVQLHGNGEHRKSAYLYEFLSPAFLSGQAVERLRLALLNEMKREPNARTKTLLACFEADCDPPTTIELDHNNCYPVSYFNDSRSYNSAAADWYLEWRVAMTPEEHMKKLGIPYRVFHGKPAGPNLLSTQVQAHEDKLIQQHQNQFTEQVIKPLLRRLGLLIDKP